MRPRHRPYEMESCLVMVRARRALPEGSESISSSLRNGELPLKLPAWLALPEGSESISSSNG
jgi:hypothetical protein